jgi:hypothetical protein
MIFPRRPGRDRVAAGRAEKKSPVRRAKRFDARKNEMIV